MTTRVISANVRQHILIEMVSYAGYSSYAASAKFRNSNTQGSPENHANAGLLSYIPLREAKDGQAAFSKDTTTSGSAFA